MEPQLRAVADRFIYDHATFKNIVMLCSEEQLHTKAPGESRALAQSLAHIGELWGEYGAALERWCHGEQPFPEGWDPEAIAAPPKDRLDRARVLEVMAAGLVRLERAFAALPDVVLATEIGGRPAMDVLHEFERHILLHAIPIIDAVPSVRMDPLVLNWALHAEFDREDQHAWQRELLAEAREHWASQPEEEQ